MAEAWFNRFGGIPVPVHPARCSSAAGRPVPRRAAAGPRGRGRARCSSPGRSRSAAPAGWPSSCTTFLAAISVAAVVLSLCVLRLAERLQPVELRRLHHVNRMEPPAFDLSGVAPLGAMLFSFALGTRAGVLIRRTVPAMALALGGYVGAILPLSSVRYTAFFRAAHRQRVVRHRQPGAAGRLHTAVHLQQRGRPSGRVSTPCTTPAPARLATGRARSRSRAWSPKASASRVIPARLQGTGRCRR